jgi:quaternary ammonium compound-resistance protein SugE
LPRASAALNPSGFVVDSSTPAFTLASARFLSLNARFLRSSCGFSLPFSTPFLLGAPPMTMAWLYLIGAGLLEIGWPVGLKIAQTPGKVWIGVPIAVVFMGLSGWLLYLAQQKIPMGTAYAVWTGIGASGTFVLGILLFGDPSNVMRIFAVALIVAGVCLLKFAH